MKKEKKYTNKELAEAYIYPSRLTPNERKKAEKEFSAYRLQRLTQMTDEDRYYSKLLQLKYMMEDYFKSNSFNETYTFSYFLNEYIHSINKKKTDFSKEISLNPTLLSNLLNNKRKPNEKIIIRLEIHSNNLIPALFWYHILEKQKELEFINNESLRKTELKNVKHKLSFTNSNR